jgi:hypothetical protein
MSCALTRRLRLVRLRRPRRHVWRRARDGVLLGHKLRRMVCLPGLLLRLGATRRWNWTLRRLRTLHLRRRLWCWPIIYLRIRARRLIHARRRSCLPRIVRNIITRWVTLDGTMVGKHSSATCVGLGRHVDLESRMAAVMSGQELRPALRRARSISVGICWPIASKRHAARHSRRTFFRPKSRRSSGT